MKLGTVKCYLQYYVYCSNIHKSRVMESSKCLLKLSNLGPAEWLLQRRVARRWRAALPSMRWWPKNTQSTLTSTFSELASRSVPLGHWRRSASLPWRNWNTRRGHGHQAQQSCLDQKNKECSISYPVQLSRKQNKNEDSPNKPYTLLTYIPVTMFKSLQTVNMDDN